MTKILKALKNEKGFTLIELVFVVIILSILAAVALINLGPTDTDARIAVVRTDLRTLATAIQVYKAKRGVFPTNLTQLTRIAGTYTPMLNAVPIDPFSTPINQQYNYVNNVTSAVVSSDHGESLTVQ